MAKGGTTTVVLRDLLASVAQQVESHFPRPGRHRRRPSRIRSWIVSVTQRDKDDVDDGNNSLHFTDASDDDDFALSDITPDSSIRDLSSFNNSNDETHHHDRRWQTQSPSLISSTNTSQVRMHIRSPDEIKEEETVDTLVSLMGDGFDREVARRILRKYDGNVEKAAGALIEGERGEELVVGSTVSGHHHPIQSSQNQGWPAGSTPVATGTAAAAGVGSTSSPGSSQTPMQTGRSSSSAVALGGGGRPNTPVIDLTSYDEDQDLQRAMRESMLQAGPANMPVYAPTPSLSQMYAPSASQLGPGQQLPNQMQMPSQPEGPVFGPSQRSPDPNWAIVPSQQQQQPQHDSNDANYLQNLNRAIEASLETMGDSDALEPFPVEQQLRRDGCPVVLRPSLHTMVYAASILQGLFYVPQVRERMACWRPPVPTDEDTAGLSVNDPEYTLWALSEIFTHMDLARLCDLNVDKRLPTFNIEPWERPAQPPGELSRKFFARLSATLEKAFIDQFARGGQPLPKPRILHFQYGSGISEPGEVLQETSIVPIDVNGGESNDLIGRLSAQLSKPHSEPGKQSVIFESSEVVAFELVRSSSTATATASGGTERKLFAYPKSIYLDQFLRENAALAQAKRGQRQAMLDEVQRLVLHKKALTHFDGKDTLSNLRSTIFYFENVADAVDDPERGVLISATTRKLKAILATIEEEIRVTDENIDALRSRADTLLDCEELRQLKYDLRVVFVHDGLYGRKHLYSYVQDKSCWWKIADSLIEKVTEEVVLNDQSGLHLGAGPYLLLYSRAIPESEGPPAALPWMDDIKDDVKAANREFLSQLPPELVGGIMIDEEGSSFSNVASSDPVLVKKGVAADMDLS